MRWLLKRWWFWAGTGFMLVAVMAGYLLIPVERNRITEANYDKIQHEWSKGEVEELLGTPKVRLEGTQITVLTWVNEDGDSIEVIFYGRGVVHKRFYPRDSDLSESPWDRMKRRVERRIRALWS
jgi:hypothetical protein